MSTIKEKKTKIIIMDEAAFPNSPSKQEFKHWAQHTLNRVLKLHESIIPAPQLNICLVDKEQSTMLNQQYRKKTGPTNVLSFEYPKMPGITPDTLGDIIICSEVTAEEALQQNKDIKAHFAHLTIHGILHLFGYDHEKDKEAEEMEQLETVLLLELGFSDPYQ